MRITIALAALLLFGGAASARTIESCGGAADGSDTTPAWNSCLAQAVASSSDRSITFGAGTYKFNSVPNKIVAEGITVKGLSPWVTHLQRTFSQANGVGFFELQGRGSYIGHLEIQTAPGTTGGYGLYIVATNATPPGGKHLIEWVRIAGTVNPTTQLHQGRWQVPLMLRGDQRTIEPIGLRLVHLQLVDVFDATFYAAEFWGTVSAMWSGGGAYQGNGSTQAVIVGGAMSTKNRIDADIDFAASTIPAALMRGAGR